MNSGMTTNGQQSMGMNNSGMGPRSMGASTVPQSMNQNQNQVGMNTPANMTQMKLTGSNSGMTGTSNMMQNTGSNMGAMNTNQVPGYNHNARWDGGAMNQPTKKPLVIIVIFMQK
jgi:hypothetical protein